MSESLHVMKQRHKAELKALQSECARAKDKGAKKKLKEDEQKLLEGHKKEIEESERKSKQERDNNEQQEESEKNQSANEFDASNNTGESAPPSAFASSSSSSSSIASSKSLKKKEKRAAAAAKSVSDARARDAESKSSLIDSHREKELQALNMRLHPIRLHIFPIISDGHCLFRAIAHQMHTYKVALESPFVDLTALSGQVDDALLLRRIACRYIESHHQQFAPFLLNDSGETESVFAYVTALSEEHDNVKWGSHTELVALANALHIPVQVYDSEAKEAINIKPNANDDVSGSSSSQIADPASVGSEIVSPKCSSSSLVFRVSFHRHYYSLGAHYNSIIPLTDDQAQDMEDAQKYIHAAGQVKLEDRSKQKSAKNCGNETDPTSKDEKSKEESNSR